MILYYYKIVSFIKKNPYVLLALGIAALILLVILLLMGSSSIENNNNNYNDGCDGISIKTTSLSRTEFIEKVEEYYEQSSNSNLQVFADNASLIYDNAVASEVNPELVVVRAILEGFSPGADYNNYWGINCTNTGAGKDCFTFNSFNGGIIGFVQLVSEYNNATEMMTNYAYLGDYWYNPGSNSMGGCRYSKQTSEFLSEQRANEVARACAEDKACSGEDCLKTEDEDQQAYIAWQVKRLVEVRQQVFGLEPDQCVNEVHNSEVVFKQGDPAWANLYLGKSAANMKYYGCAVTSIANGINRYATNLTVNNFDAGVFVRILNNNGCFTDTGGIYWGCQAISNIAPEVSWVTTIREIKSYSNLRKKSLIDSYSNNNNFIIIGYDNEETWSHFVLFNGFLDDINYSSIDPAPGTIKPHKISDINQIVVYNYKKR